MNTNWTEVLQVSFQGMWLEVTALTPKLILAAIIILLGIITAAVLKKFVRTVADRLQIDAALAAAGLTTYTEKTGYSLNVGGFIGTLIKWFVLVLFFVVALDVLGLDEATTFLRDVVLGYLPNVIVATIILFGAIVIANAVSKSIRVAAEAARVQHALLLSKFAKVAIIIFAILAALNQLKIAPELVQMLFAGVVFALSLALGLAFGLGGKSTAAAYLDRYTRE